ncbi:DUF3267 domain-containing protein [Staphylococcus sp. SQ8-PEA]|uniref:DUF3267 domain-containing protein n=1 Tax=Staphylococcus marylandisciuri TaxID=2981529 RepID=A0ABT2QQI2_9STAP|nr:DUF3267 domain-containing protein [Staphylococcus marylandisciuri]MCU5746210.1 DUF3267 domain-containing protein [Staphylococcus marylandisciuri]
MVKLNFFNEKKSIERFMLLQLIVIMISILVCYKGAHLFTHIHEQNFFLNILFGMIGAAFMVVIHEIIHFILYHLFASDRRPLIRKRFGIITSYVPDKVFKKWEYIIILVAPLIIISLGLLGVFVFFPYSSFIFIASIHVGYCLVDLYFIISAWNAKVKYIEDNRDGVIFYTREDKVKRELD